MTYSQINQPKGWGFSRSIENLTIFKNEVTPNLEEYSIFGDATGQTKIGDFS